MIDKIEGVIKGLFTGDGIVDELLTDKGVRMVIDRIPEDVIEWLSKIEHSEFFINVVAVGISKMLPEKHLERAKDVLRTVVSSLDEKVDDYRRHHGIEKPGKEKQIEDAQTAEAKSAGPSPAEIVAEYRSLLLYVRFRNKKAARLAALNSIYERPNVKSDKRYFGVAKDAYRSKVNEALANLSEDDFLTLLDDTPRNRILFINNAVGELPINKPTRSGKQVLDDIDSATANGLKPITQALRRHNRRAQQAAKPWYVFW